MLREVELEKETQQTPNTSDGCSFPDYYGYDTMSLNSFQHIAN